MSATSITEAKSYFGGLDSSILLYNFGNAYLALSSVLPDAEASSNLYECALQIYQLSASNLDSSAMGRAVEDMHASHLLPFSFLLHENLDRIGLLRRLPEPDGVLSLLMSNMLAYFVNIRAAGCLTLKMPAPAA
jgi:hypothetical protein